MQNRRDSKDKNSCLWNPFSRFFSPFATSWLHRVEKVRRSHNCDKNLRLYENIADGRRLQKVPSPHFGPKNTFTGTGTSNGDLFRRESLKTQPESFSSLEYCNLFEKSTLCKNRKMRRNVAFRTVFRRQNGVPVPYFGP